MRLPWPGIPRMVLEVVMWRG